MSLSRVDEAWEAGPGDGIEACEGDLAGLEGVQEGSVSSPEDEMALRESTLCASGQGGFPLFFCWLQLPFPCVCGAGAGSHLGSLLRHMRREVGAAVVPPR